MTKTSISLHSQSLDGSTGLPEDFLNVADKEISIAASRGFSELTQNVQRKKFVRQFGK